MFLFTKSQNTQANKNLTEENGQQKSLLKKHTCTIVERLFDSKAYLTYLISKCFRIKPLAFFSIYNVDQSQTGWTTIFLMTQIVKICLASISQKVLQNMFSFSSNKK